MKIYASGTKLVDEYGRQRIFRGENICIKKPKINCKKLSENLNTHFDYIIASGANIIRLGVTWALIEPEERKYNDEAISVFHNFVKKCEKQNIAVILDMHQDLFSKKFFGDGAPKWAIDQSIKPQRYLAIWAEGYFYMDSVQKAFDDFWKNKNNIQEKFSRMYKYFREQFSDCENIIGNDFFNEPYVTDNGRKVFLSIVKNVVKENYNIDIDTFSYFENKSERIAITNLVKDISKIVSKNGGAVKLLKDTDNYQQFARVIGGLEKYTDDFNSKYYQPFIDKMNDTCSKDDLTFFEHNYYSNLGIPFDIKTKENYIYSPHAYDIFVDSPLYNNFSSNNRIKFITDTIRQNQLKMNVPVVFGEWGCGANSGNKWIDHIEYVMDIMEENQWSNIYWSYRHHNKEFRNRINRPYPVAICGNILEYKTDSKERTFCLKFIQDKNLVNLDNEIYIPKKGIYRFKAKAGKNIITIKY